MTTWVTEPANALPGTALREAFMRSFREHPALAHYALTGDQKTYRISDFISQRQFHDLTLYNEYYRPSSVEYQIIASITQAPGQMAGIALDRDRCDFTENERLSLDLIRPHLVQAYRNVQTLDLMRRTVEERGARLVVVSRSGQVPLNSDDVWHTLARYFDVPRSRKCLPDVLNRWIDFERSRFCQDSDAPFPSVPLVVSNESGRLALQFIWGGKVAGQDLLLLEEEPAGLGSVLTRREAEILTWLSQGKTNAEIGEALSISPRTVKKHLEHIYSKLKVHRRTAALARSHYL
jgi:DNA-binding CsgD family transcriptional regulator